MDAATTSSRDARRCARPGCADLAVATLAFRYDRQQAWLTTLVEDKSPATYDLCGPCADRTAPPRGWELVDERPDLDGLADPVEERDAVRDAIAAALRGGEPSPANRALSVVPDPPAQPVAPPETAPAALAPEPAALAPEPAALAPEPAAPPPPAAPAATEVPPAAAPPSAESEPVRATTSVSELGDRPRPRRRRRRPVEVLIEGPEHSRESNGSSRTWRVTTSHQPGSHAPTSHRLGSVAVPRPEPTPATAAGEPRPGPDAGPEAVVAPAATAVPAIATAVDVPLAFDTVPDRLVQVEPHRATPRG